MSGAVAEQELADVAAEIAQAAALTRKRLVEAADYLADDSRAAPEPPPVVQKKPAANFGRVPAGVAIATLTLARALSVLDEDSDDDAEDVKPAPPTPPISEPMF